MKYVEFSDTRFVVDDNPTFSFLPYPGIGNTSLIKVVSKKNLIDDVAITYHFDHSKGQYIRYFHSSATAKYSMGVAVVYSFDYSMYFYLLYDTNSPSSSGLGLYVQNNTVSPDCLALTGTFANASIKEALCPHLNFQEELVDKSDFPSANVSDLKNIQKLGFYGPILISHTKISMPKSSVESPETQRSNYEKAVCSCGYVSEYAEASKDYLCPQCKIWKNLI